MKLPLKYFLILSLILGAVVGPFGYRKYQAWRKRRETKSSAIAIQFMRASEVAAVVRELYRERLKPSGSSKPELSLLVDEQANLLMISAPDRLLREIKQVVKSIDQSGSAKPPQRVMPIGTGSPQEIRRALEKLLPGTGRPAPTDIS